MNSRNKINVAASAMSFWASAVLVALAFSQSSLFLIPSALFALSGGIFLGLALSKRK